VIGAFLVSLAVVAIYVWQDGFILCPDGQRYTSGIPQPHPFHRRWCGWPRNLLMGVSLVSLVALGTLMGSWWRALVFVTLPGAWLCATRPTTVDCPTMLLSLVSAMLFPTHPYAAVFVSCVSGFIHERGPVFAAIYAWHPLPLIGLVCIGWWRKPAPPDQDMRVGRGTVHAIFNHRVDHDWLDWKQTFWAMRGLPFLAAAFGVSTSAWVALGLTWTTRLICTDLGRMVLWAGPVMIRDLPEVPAWMVLVHAVTFRRMG
jgi:hypothetical protein